MAKYYGTATKSGKVGGSVFLIRHGETIERQYQPVVSNPKTTKQVGVRAALKLLSQVSAALADIIAFRRQGNVSPRNLFTRTNYPAVDVNGDTTAAIEVSEMDLTGGVVAMPELITPLVSGSSVSIGLQSAADSRVSRVLYALVGIKQGDRMTVLDKVIVEEAGSGRTFSGSLTLPSGATGRMAIFAYGVGDLTMDARVAYQNYLIDQDPAAATLTAIRMLTANDVMLTKTVTSSFTLA